MDSGNRNQRSLRRRQMDSRRPSTTITNIRYYKQNRFNSLAAAIFLVKGLIIVLVASCYMYRKLTQHVSVDVDACVRKVENKCELYPCQVQYNGAIEEVASPSPYFGYGGHFVHRDENIGKALPETLGDTGWDSGCILSDEYKFVFIHVLKSGGTAVKNFIKNSLCGPDDSDCEHAPPTLVRAEGCIKSIRDHQDYFHFSFVRNPFSRLYSAYSMMDGFPPSNGIRGRLPTKDLSFAEFVLHPGKREMHTSMFPGHYDPQYPFLFSQPGLPPQDPVPDDEEKCPMFDFLGRLEYFDEDMRRILNHLNATKMLDYMDSIGGRISSANSWGSAKKMTTGGLRKEYSTPQIMATVASNYFKDFQLLGYNINEVPER